MMIGLQPTATNILLELIVLVNLALATYSSFRILDRQREVLHDLRKSPWIYISTGLSLWFISKLILLFFLVVLTETSCIVKICVTNIVSLGGYLFLFSGFHRGIKPFLRLKNNHPHVNWLNIIDATFSLTVILIVAFFFLHLPYLNAEELYPKLFFTPVFTVFDIVLLWLSLKGMVIFYGGTASKPLHFISLGFMLVATSNILRLFVFHNGIYLVDLILASGYLVLAGGMYLYSRSTPIF